MKIIKHLTLFLLLVMIGCQGDDPGITEPNNQQEVLTGVIQGEIAAGTLAFEFSSQANLQTENPPPGPFLIRGYNVVYDDTLGVLSVDITVVNASTENFPEPVSLTFVQLLPAEVTVDNADNGETGPGATFLCEFANDDAMWTPDEESLPRTIQFGVGAGVSIGFVVRVDVGLLPEGGAIGGLVWHDANEDGVIDDGEEGIEGVQLNLTGDSGEPLETMTDAGGSYHFDGLEAGYYTVTRMPREDLEGTTPAAMQVILVEDGDEISDFLAANFGCRIIDEPAEEIAVGDCVHAKGEFATDPDRLVATLLSWCDGENEEDDDDDEDKLCDPCWYRLVGPITDQDLGNDAVAVMGTWLQLADKNGDDEVFAIGDRVMAKITIVEEEDEQLLVACRLHRFMGHYDRIRGHVQELILDEDDQVVQIRVLDTLIDIDQVMECEDENKDD
ncbi:MAG: SdrD B-like domain-containing protein [bacterium]